MSNETIQINQQEVISKLSALSDRYEKALIDADFETVKHFFWDSDKALRFGVTEELYGVEEIRAFQDKRPFKLTGRQVLRKNIVSFSDKFAVVTVEFTMELAEKLRHGRQTQVWVCLQTDDWKIVSAHVSHRLDLSSEKYSEKNAIYTQLASTLVQLPIAEGDAEDVVRLFSITERLAQPLMDFPLADDDEIAGVFKP